MESYWAICLQPNQTTGVMENAQRITQNYWNMDWTRRCVTYRIERIRTIYLIASPIALLGCWKIGRHIQNWQIGTHRTR